MDSKHRHELEQNELAKWLISQYEDWIRPNSSWLGYAVLGLLVVIAVIFATARVNTWNRNAEWKDFYIALSAEDPNAALDAVAQSTRSVVGAHARLALAQRQLSEGCITAFSDKTESIVLLEKAMATFQQVQKATNDPMILQEAGFGLGYCRETLAGVRVGDDITKAEEEYQQVIERWKDGFMGQLAQQRLAQIRQPATQEFLKLLAAKTVETPAGMEDFRVNITSDDPFAPGGGGFNLDDLFNQEGTTEEPAPEPEQ